MSTLTSIIGWISAVTDYRRFCASAAVFTQTVSAYVNLIDFGLTAKHPLFSTRSSVGLKISNRVKMCTHPMITFLNVTNSFPCNGLDM
jgi:hypothetical protein